MSNNGKPIDLLRVTLRDGKMFVVFGGNNVALNSHAVRLASLELDNKIIQMAQEKEESSIQVPKGLIR